MTKIILYASATVVLLIAFAFWQYLRFYDRRLHVVFCNVGQGDAIFITTPNRKHILVDSGPDKRVLDCLANHMPFWDRKIDLAILTHPHRDHYSGYYYILQRNVITQFATEDLKNKTAGFAELLRLLKERKIPQAFVLSGDHWQIGDVRLIIAGPTQEFLNTTSPGGFIGEGKEFASVITQLTYGSFALLLTGDSQVAGLTDASINSTVDVIQAPHHGSASGLNEHVLSVLQPKLAVISVGKNKYGHPTTFTLDLLQQLGIPTLRTDRAGDVEIVSDGKTITVN